MEDLIHKIVEQQKNITFLMIVVSLVGGVAKYAKEYLDTGVFSFAKLLSNLVIAGFAGLMFGYFGDLFGVSENVRLMLAGVGGFMGYESLTFLFNQITKKFNTNNI